MVHIVVVKIPKWLLSKQKLTFCDDERRVNGNDRPTAIEIKLICSKGVETNKIIYKSNRVQHILKAGESLVCKLDALFDAKISLVWRKHIKICKKKHLRCQSLRGMLLEQTDPWADANVKCNILPFEWMGWVAIPPYFYNLHDKRFASMSMCVEIEVNHTHLQITLNSNSNQPGDAAHSES